MSDNSPRIFTRPNRGSKIESLLASEGVEQGDFWGSDEVNAIFAEDEDDADFQAVGLCIIS